MSFFIIIILNKLEVCCYILENIIKQPTTQIRRFLVVELLVVTQAI